MSKRFIKMPPNFENARRIFKEEVAKRGFVLLNSYQGVNKNVKLRCPNGHVFEINPSHFKKGQGCKKCSGRDHEYQVSRFISIIESQGGTVRGTYKNHKTRVECVCSEGHLCLVLPISMVRGYNMCQTCPGEDVKMAEKKFYETAREAGVIVRGQYKNSSTLIEMICPNGHLKYSLPNKTSLLACTQCFDQIRQLAGERFKKTMLDKGYTVLGDYLGRRYRIMCKCPLGHICFVYPCTAYKDVGLCKTCSPKSRGEDKVQKALSELGINVMREISFPGESYRYDFQLLGKKIIIEVDGTQHFIVTPFRPTDWHLTRGQIVDTLKTLVAIKNGYKILRIDYTWFHLPVEDYVKFIKEYLDKPWDSLPNYTYNNPSNYTWLTDRLSEIEQLVSTSA